MTPSRIELVSVALLGLLAAAGVRGETKDPPEVAPVVNDTRFQEQLLKVAEKYAGYGRVDDEMRWAPGLCRGPLPGQARFSRSPDEATHGLKLYSVFAGDRSAYLSAADRPSPVGQVLVKESWVPEEVKRDPLAGQTGLPGTALAPGKDLARADHFNPFAQKGGKVYKAARKSDLFIMMKLPPETPGTDGGWVYGTVTPDGKTVTSAGRVVSCVRCHEMRPDRRFGLPAEGPGR
jgi:hypothetical protein